ncbi:MAG: hypothetical protein HLX50_24110 [Alteromonadaceae bacterium]|nr:hypothetical protein [Alteromonadaceae bacterium]
MATYQLELNHFMFPSISSKANKDHFTNAKEQKLRKPVFNLEFEYRLDAENHWLIIELAIETKELNELDAYDFKLEAFANFQILSGESPEPSLDESFLDNALKPLVVNAVQILSGCCRDALHSVTAKGPYGPLILPMVFINPKDVPDPATQKSEPSE